jgi:hypothetical protein
LRSKANTNPNAVQRDADKCLVYGMAYSQDIVYVAGVKIDRLLAVVKVYFS